MSLTEVENVECHSFSFRVSCSVTAVYSEVMGRGRGGALNYREFCFP